MYNNFSQYPNRRSIFVDAGELSGERRDGSTRTPPGATSLWNEFLGGGQLYAKEKGSNYNWGPETGEWDTIKFSEVS